jgi:hypothetical protein
MTVQQEVFPPEPARTISGRGLYGWGVDPSTKRVSIAWATADGEHGVATRSFPNEPNLGRRYALIYSETVQFVSKLATDIGWPGLVWIEQASGKQQNPRLVYAIGVIIAGVFAGLWHAQAKIAETYEGAARHFPLPEIETIESARWKKRALGPGWARLKKEDGAIIRWAQETVGYTGSLYDEADALGIAEALRRTVRLTP